MHYVSMYWTCMQCNVHMVGIYVCRNMYIYIYIYYSWMYISTYVASSLFVQGSCNAQTTKETTEVFGKKWQRKSEPPGEVAVKLIKAWIPLSFSALTQKTGMTQTSKKTWGNPSIAQRGRSRALSPWGFHIFGPRFDDSDDEWLSDSDEWEHLQISSFAHRNDRLELSTTNSTEAGWSTNAKQDQQKPGNTK